MCVPAEHTLLNVFHDTLHLTQKCTTETQYVYKGTFRQNIYVYVQSQKRSENGDILTLKLTHWVKSAKCRTL